MHYLRNLGRRKVRTTLTVLGITIGIWALVVFGSMANKISALVDGGSAYYEDKLTLSDKSGSQGGFSSAPMSLAMADQVREVEGVDVVVPAIMMLMEDQMAGVAMGVPPMITAAVAGSDDGRETFVINYAQGRALTAEDEGSLVAVLGSDIARKFSKDVGDTIVFKSVEFEVVGVMEPTLTAPDQAAAIPFEAAQILFIKTLPPMVQARLNAADLVSSMTVFPEVGVDPEILADRIVAEIPGVAAMTGRDFDEQIGGGDRHPQLDPRRDRPHQPGRRRPVGDQHDGHVDRRADARDRDQAGNRRQPLPDRPRARHRIGPHRVHRRRDRARPRGRRGHLRERGGPLIRDRPVRADAGDGGLGRRVRDDPRRLRRLRPGPPRGPARPGRRPSLRMTAQPEAGDRTMPLLQGSNLRKTYHLSKRNSVHALRGVDVSIEAGEMVAIMGPSGSGKSTLMHILGLLHGPDRDDGPLPGLAFAGRDMVDVGEGDRTKIRARQMGFVFQDFNLVPTLTAIENVMLACDYAGVRGSEAKAKALGALDLVGLAERADHRPAELSGGEQQRVAIARALVNKPALVLADEPTGNLDSERTADVLALLRDFNRREGQTFILVTHEPDVAFACDRIIRMRDGTIREDIRTPVREPGLDQVLEPGREPVLAG